MNKLKEEFEDNIKSKKILNSDIGKINEKIAISFLKKNCKYKILETNFYTSIGEIDIIAKDKDTIVFIEVKYSTTSYFGLPRERVNSYKQNKIRQVAFIYLKNKKLLNSKCRFDVIDILGEKITHIKDCFW